MKEGTGGFVELIYEQLAPRKVGTKPLFVFWDKKCLKMGQNWEDGFLHGITSANVIILLLSNKVQMKRTTKLKKGRHSAKLNKINNYKLTLCKVIEGICSAAPNRQDNVLLEYPSFFLYFSCLLFFFVC